MRDLRHPAEDLPEAQILAPSRDPLRIRESSCLVPASPCRMPIIASPGASGYEAVHRFAKGAGRRCGLRADGRNRAWRGFAGTGHTARIDLAARDFAGASSSNYRAKDPWGATTGVARRHHAKRL